MSHDGKRSPRRTTSVQVLQDLTPSLLVRCCVFEREREVCAYLKASMSLIDRRLTTTSTQSRDMSAYGVINRSNSASLPSTTWLLRSKHPDPPSLITIHHLTLQTAEKVPGLVDYLHGVFAEELERGQTYPQEITTGDVYTRDQFTTYYLAADVLVGVQGRQGDPLDRAEDGSQVSTGITEAIGRRTLEESIAGCYYVSVSDFWKPFAIDPALAWLECGSTASHPDPLIMTADRFCSVGKAELPRSLLTCEYPISVLKPIRYIAHSVRRWMYSAARCSRRSITISKGLFAIPSRLIPSSVTVLLGEGASGHGPFRLSSVRLRLGAS